MLKIIPLGTRIFYIGEGFGGCTGDDDFHKYLCDKFKEIKIVALPTFAGIHDALFIYEKLGD